MERPADSPAELEFEPVPLRRPQDGWTPERQRLCVVALSLWGSGGRAAAFVGMSEQTAARLRAGLGADSFNRACDLARRRGKRRRRRRQPGAAAAASARDLSLPREPNLMKISNLPLRDGARRSKPKGSDDLVPQRLAHMSG